MDGLIASLSDTSEAVMPRAVMSVSVLSNIVDRGTVFLPSQYGQVMWCISIAK